MTAPLVVVGDALLDRDVEGSVERLSPEGPVPVLDERRASARPGGAALAATLAALDGWRVRLVTALGSDESGRELGSLLAGAGVEVCDLGLKGETPQKIRFLCDGRALLRLDRGGRAAGAGRRPASWAAGAFDDAAAVLVSDYGRGLAGSDGMRKLLAEAARARPLVWDPHPRGADPVRGTRLATPNASEAERLADAGEGEARGRAGVRLCARALLGRWEVDAVAVTLGPDGALLVTGESPPVLAPAPPAPGGDPCGAGDRFATRVAEALAEGQLLVAAVHQGVAAASAFVAAGGAGAVDLSSSDAPGPGPALSGSIDELLARTRASGGTVVMTGGCFDLLHAGHVRMLEAARALGDCLVVCLNSDESVGRLKGGGRPVVAEGDRAALLLALGCVDGVVVFDEDTPTATLERYRPDVFVKGGDYAFETLPEAATVSRWGGETVILPYEEGRSTTRLLEEVLARAG